MIAPGDVFRVPLMWLMQDSHIDLYIVKKILIAKKPEKEEQKRQKNVRIDESGYQTKPVKNEESPTLLLSQEEHSNQPKMIWQDDINLEKVLLF